MNEFDVYAEADRLAAAYLKSLPNRPAFPSQAAIDALSGLDDHLPEIGETPGEVLARLDALATPATTASGGGRYFGFVIGGALPAAHAADRLALAWDQCASSANNSPAAAMIETVAARHVLEALDLPRDSAVGFGTSATACGLSCLTAGRRALLAEAGWDFDRKGLVGAPIIRFVVPETAHVTVIKALRIMGVGTDHIIRAPCDDQGRIDPARLPEMDALTLLCLQAGEVNTGSFDRFGQLIPSAKRAGAWVHVDGAFGLWARASRSLHHLTDGIEMADSWTTDGHKWLNVPYDSAMAICRHPQALAEAMNSDAAYATADARAQKNLTLEFSRRLRGVSVWAALRSLGRSGLEDMLDRNVRHARRLADGLKAMGLNVLNDGPINQVLARAGDDEATHRLIKTVQAEGTVWFGATLWQERPAFRLSCSNWRTQDADIETALQAIRRALD
jgi:glutamate/tyrosine decarboxylase-like PLP-dependent enzyme